MFRKRDSDEGIGISHLASYADNTKIQNTQDNNVLIQRLIILHDGLMPLVLPSSSKKKKNTSMHAKNRRNPQSLLSENASLEEHGEFILYYYDHSLHFPTKTTTTPPDKDQSNRRRKTVPTPTPPTTTLPSRNRDNMRRMSSDKSLEKDNNSNSKKPPEDYATEEAVRFAGICRALRSLPQALQAEEIEDHQHTDEEKNEKEDNVISETRIVHLNESTLVFVSLELRGDIVAVAQIVRANNSSQQRSSSNYNMSSDSRYLQENQQQRQRSRNGFGADPLAIQRAIRDIHTTFS